MELAKGIAYCGSCGAPLVTRKSVCSGTEYFRYVCRDDCRSSHGISATEFDKSICGYLKRLTSEEVRWQVDKELADYAKERNVDIRNERMKRIRELRTMSLDRCIPRDIQAALRECVRQLELVTSEHVQVVRQEIGSDSYFSVPVPESMEADPEGMRKAAQWYIQRATLHEASIEFSSTFNDWLRKNASEICPVRLSAYMAEK